MAGCGKAVRDRKNCKPEDLSVEVFVPLTSVASKRGTLWECPCPGKAIKEASPFPTTIVITHCNGTAGYLPTKASYTEGGFEVQTSQFGPDAAEQVIKETVQMLKQLQ